MNGFEAELLALVAKWKGRGADMPSMLRTLKAEHDAMAELIAAVDRLASLPTPEREQGGAG